MSFPALWVSIDAGAVIFDITRDIVVRLRSSDKECRRIGIEGALRARVQELRNDEAITDTDAARANQAIEERFKRQR